MYNALIWMESHGLVTCTSRSKQASAWELSDVGKRCLRSATVLGECDYPLQVAREVPIEHANTFELLMQLESAGWQCDVQGRGEKVAEPYVKGGSKVLWLKHNATTFNHYYLWALLVADDIDAEQIEPFQTTEYYQCLIKGDLKFTYRVSFEYR